MMLKGFLAGLLMKMSVACMPAAGLAVGPPLPHSTDGQTPAAARIEQAVTARCEGRKPAVSGKI